MLSLTSLLPLSAVLLLLAGSSVCDAASVPSVRRAAGRRKAGLAWPNWANDQPEAWAARMGNSWYYTWSAWWTGGMEALEFVPMLWGPNMLDDFNGAYPFYTEFNVTTALFVNEPNNDGQANIDAATGCSLWTDHFEQLRTVVPGIKLASAAPDNSPSGKQWLLDFQSLCPQNDPDLIALHWYGTSHLDFQNYVLDMYATFNKPIMVTEYACSGTPDCTWEYIEGDFFQGTTVWMIGRPEIYRFSEFGAIPNLPNSTIANALMTSNGDPTPLGLLYANSENT